MNEQQFETLMCALTSIDKSLQMITQIQAQRQELLEKSVDLQQESLALGYKLLVKPENIDPDGDTGGPIEN